MRKRGHGFSVFFKNGVGVPSSVSRSNSWKSGKVSVSLRFTTMGVKVGGVETQGSYRRLDLWINGSGFRDAFNCCWEKRRREIGRRGLTLQTGKYDKESFFYFKSSFS